MTWPAISPFVRLQLVLPSLRVATSRMKKISIICDFREKNHLTHPPPHSPFVFSTFIHLNFLFLPLCPPFSHTVKRKHDFLDEPMMVKTLLSMWGESKTGFHYGISQSLLQFVLLCPTMKKENFVSAPLKSKWPCEVAKLEAALLAADGQQNMGMLILCVRYQSYTLSRTVNLTTQNSVYFGLRVVSLYWRLIQMSHVTGPSAHDGSGHKLVYKLV